MQEQRFARAALARIVRAPRGVPGSVLVVDDDPSVVAALREALVPREVVVETADTAERAAEMLDQGRYCGLVLDLVLANGSGFDVLRHIHQRKLVVPTIVVTSKLPSYVREMLDAEHVKLVFPKPVEPRLLAAIVLGLCGMDNGSDGVGVGD